AQAAGGGGQINGTRLRRRVSDGRPRLFYGQAAGGGTFVWARRCGHGDHADAGKIDVELVGRDLRQSGEDALTDLDLAGAQFDKACRIEAQPPRQTWIGLEVGG